MILAKVLSLLFLAASLAGCASYEERKAEFTAWYDRWIGKSTDALVKRYGAPMSTYTLTTGETVMEFNRSSTHTSGGQLYTTTGQAVVDGKTVNVKQAQTSQVSVYTAECFVTFQASAKGIIESWKSRGSGCF